MTESRVQTLLLGVITALLVVVVVQNLPPSTPAPGRVSVFPTPGPTPLEVTLQEPLEVQIVGPLTNCGSISFPDDCVYVLTPTEVQIVDR